MSSRQGTGIPGHACAWGNKYAQRTSRQRDRLEDEGRRDDEAARLTKRAMAEQARPTWPAARSERARGPYGDRTAGGGDPGNVIDPRSPAFSPNDAIPPAYTKTGTTAYRRWSGPASRTAPPSWRYGGPQPPVGDDPHRYVFRLYALKRPLPRDTKDVREAIEEDPLATGTLVGTFAR